MNLEKMLEELQRHGLRAGYSALSNFIRGYWVENPLQEDELVDNEVIGSIFYVDYVSEKWQVHVLCGQKTIRIRLTQDLTLVADSIKSYFSLVKRSNMNLDEFSANLKDCIDAGFRVEIGLDQKIEFHRDVKEPDSFERIWLTDDLKWRLEWVDQENHTIQGKMHESFGDAISSLLNI